MTSFEESSYDDSDDIEAFDKAVTSILKQLRDLRSRVGPDETYRFYPVLEAVADELGIESPRQYAYSCRKALEEALVKIQDSEHSR